MDETELVAALVRKRTAMPNRWVANRLGLGHDFFGTNPGVCNSGLMAGTKAANTFTFTHPQNASPAPDLAVSHRWSKDLASFHAGGVTYGGPRVNFTTQASTPSPGTTKVTATIIGTQSVKLLVRVGVSST